MKRRILLVVLAISIAIVGCGKKSENIQKETKEEHVHEEISKEIPKEQVDDKKEAKTEEDGDGSKEEPKVTTGEQQEKEETQTPVATTTPTTPTQPENKVEACEHWYNLESKSYEYIEQMVWACNGCGYPLFTIENGKPVNFDDMYFHPAYYSEKLGRECTGGGFHSEMFHSGFCGECHDAIMWRQCMFSEMGKTCVKNEVLGAYEKVELGQNPQAFWKSCSCGMDQICVGQATLDNNYGGLLYTKMVCTICGYTINYPKK